MEGEKKRGGEEERRARESTGWRRSRATPTDPPLRWQIIRIQLKMRKTGIDGVRDHEDARIPEMLPHCLSVSCSPGYWMLLT